MPAIIECRAVGKCFTLWTSRYRLLKDRVLAEVRPHLRKTAKVLWVLWDVSLAVEPGEVLAIIGPNGLGKTTLFRIISGIFQASSGSVHIRGRMAPLLALGVGFHDDLTGRENIY